MTFAPIGAVRADPAARPRDRQGPRRRPAATIVLRWADRSPRRGQQRERDRRADDAGDEPRAGTRLTVETRNQPVRTGAPARGRLAQDRHGRRDRQQVLVPLHRPQHEEHGRNDDPTQQQGLSPGAVATEERRTPMTASSDHTETERLRDVVEVEREPVVRPAQHLPEEELLARSCCASPRRPRAGTTITNAARGSRARRRASRRRTRRFGVRIMNAYMATARRMPVSLVRKVRPSADARARRAMRLATLREPRGQAERERREEHHRSVEQHLAIHNDGCTA